MPSRVEQMFDRFFIPTTTAEQQEAYATVAAHYDSEYSCSVTHGRCFHLLEPYLPKEGKIRFLDAGCGTGLLSRHVRQSARSADIELIGLDYSPEMMAEAKKTGAYSSFIRADFSAPFSLGEGSDEMVDAFLISAIFVHNHCELDVLTNIAAHLRHGAHAVFSVRSEMYDVDPTKPDKAIADASCTLVKMTKEPYGRNAMYTGYYYVIKKNEQ